MMIELLLDCPRCYAKHTTFSVLGVNNPSGNGRYELFCKCRNCHRSVIFQTDLYAQAINAINQNKNANITKEMINTSVVCIRPGKQVLPPEHLPEDIGINFNEGAECYSIGCHNAAATMFRLCLDKATKSFLPDDTTNPNAAIRRSLGLRMNWLFDNGHLPVSLKDLAECIKDDGNDGAHDGILSKADVDDLIDFTITLLERLYTEPKKLELAKQRRIERRQQQ